MEWRQSIGKLCVCQADQVSESHLIASYVGDSLMTEQPMLYQQIRHTGMQATTHGPVSDPLHLSGCLICEYLCYYVI